MHFFDALICNIIYITFPLLLYVLYIIYNKNIGKKENNLFFDFALVTSLYLVIRLKINPYYIFTLDAILLVTYYTKRKEAISFMSLIIPLYKYLTLNYNIYFLILEYTIYYLIFLLFERKKNYKFLYFYLTFIVTKTISFNLTSFNNLNMFLRLKENIIMLSTLLITSYLSILIFKTSKDIIKYHMTLKELENDKQIRASLFKITHEIKNPIAVCKGYLDMFDPNNPEHARKYIPIVKEEIERTLFLLQDFLAMKQIKITKDIIDINFLLEELKDNLTMILKENAINFTLLESDDELFILGDYNRLMQVFINIVKNSIEAMPEKDNKNISVEVSEGKNNITIKVVDNGSGMSKEVLKKFKEPFYTTKAKGTGLGVSLSIEIIEAHDGSITYDSTEFEGTTVTVLLPKYQEC